MTRATLFLLVCLGACEGTDSAPDSSDAPDASVEMQPGCVAPDSAPEMPSTIEDIVAVINALPKPLQLPCLLEVLPRPLGVNAAQSILSAQPASGKRSPRIFLFLDPLILSIVPAGEGQHLLEFGEQRSETHTLKAELEFPIEAPLDPAVSPYTRLRFDDDHTTCGFCHAAEEPARDVAHPYARTSRGIRPMPSQHVTVTQLQAEVMACDAAEEPERCAMLEALFRGGVPVEREFPAEWKTFF